LYQVDHVGNSPSINLKLISREIIFEVFQFPTYVITVPKRYGRTDRRHTVASPRYASHRAVKKTIKTLLN